MNRVLYVLTLAMALLLPNFGSAQVYQARTPPPPATTQYEPWQFEDEPILVNGLIYYPTRATRFFDGEIMSQVGVYRRVPVYADVTLEPYSVIYLPIGRQLMRAYERRRQTERPPDVQLMPLSSVATSGTTLPVPAFETVFAASDRETIPRPLPAHVESIPPPRDNDGVWLEYAGARWYSDGPAVAFDADRFVEIGNYRGFPVYRDKSRGADEIWVRVVIDGAVAPYVKR